MTMQECVALNTSESNCSNDTLQQNSPSGDDDENSERKRELSSLVGAFQISMATIPVEAFALVILALGILINGFVLTAIVKVPFKALQAKFLLINCLIANVTYPLFAKVPSIIIWICMAYGLNDPLTFACLEFITWFVPPLAVVAQGFFAISLACDRIYAVCFPLIYKTTGYSKPAKSMVVFTQLFLSVGLLLPAVILPLQMDRTGDEDFCTTLIPGYYLYTRQLRSICLIVFAIVTFALYTFIFVYLKCKTVVQSAQRHGEVSRKSITLTIAYFAVHLTTVLLSAPPSLYAVYIDTAIKGTPSGNTRVVLQLLVILLLFNPIIDAIILTWKIPAIRKKLPFRLSLCVSLSRDSSSNPPRDVGISTVQQGRTKTSNERDSQN